MSVADLKERSDLVREFIARSAVASGRQQAIVALHELTVLAQQVGPLDKALAASEIKVASLEEQLEASRREVEEWKVEADRGKWPKEKAQEFFRLQARERELQEQLETAQEALQVVGRHLEDCCRTDIDLGEQMDTHNDAVNAVCRAERASFPAKDRCEKCWHESHKPGCCGVNVGTGYFGPVACRCGAPDPARQPDVSEGGCLEAAQPIEQGQSDPGRPLSETSDPATSSEGVGTMPDAGHEAPSEASSPAWGEDGRHLFASDLPDSFREPRRLISPGSDVSRSEPGAATSPASFPASKPPDSPEERAADARWEFVQENEWTPGNANRDYSPATESAVVRGADMSGPSGVPVADSVPASEPKEV